MGTSCFIEGRALEALGLKNDAKHAYETTCKYPNVRTWEIQKAGSDRLVKAHRIDRACLRNDSSGCHFCPEHYGVLGVVPFHVLASA